MSDIAIRVENLGKQYKIGRLQQRHDTLRDQISDFRFQISDLVKRRNGHNHKSEIINQKSSDSIWALRDVSFEVKRGEVVGIIGRNGAGKSTLLKILSRITEPTTGTVDLYGRVASLLEVGTGFHPELTGRENIFLNGAILGMRKAEIEKKFDEIVAFAEVEKFIDTPVKRYSSGMYVRLAFAVAAHLEPEILVVDEVLAVGDAAFQKKCLGKMGDVAKEGRTVLFVSHNMGAIRQLCRSCMWVHEGTIRQEGDVTEVIEDYLKSEDTSAGASEKYFAQDLEKEFQLCRVRMMNQKNLITRNFQCDEPVIIALTCQVRNKVPGLYGYLQLSKLDGTIVMVSDSYDGGMNPLGALSIGTHEISIVIPPRNLGHGDYQVYLNFTSRQGLRAFNIDSPGVVGSFSLSDTRSRRGDRRPGFFSTLLDWNVD